MARVMSRRSDTLSRLAIVAVVLCFLTPNAALATDAPPEEPPAIGELGLASDESVPHSQDHVLVKTEEDGVTTMGTLGARAEEVGGGWHEVPVPAGWEPIEWVEEMSTRPGIELAELDVILTPQATPPFVSPDPLYNDTSSTAWQWHLHAANVGTSWLSTVGAGVTVAVLDTGVSEGADGFCHPFVAEYDAAGNVSGPGTASDVDASFHGSHVAGSVAQCSDNGLGGSGMAPEAAIMPIRVFPGGGGGANTAAVARGLDWAVAHGARVINMSIGCGNCPGSSTLDDAIQRAANAGVVLVAAAGNSPIDVHYPARHPSVTAVGSITRSGFVASYSARGTGLDLVAPGGAGGAPGEFIWQDTPVGFDGIAGTSMASAHVSGSAALLISRFPTATAAQVSNALVCSAGDIETPGWDALSGFGRLDAGAAVEQLRLMMSQGTSNCVGVASSNARYASVQVNAGLWRLHRGSSLVTSFYYGNPGDHGFMGDWDCDGIDTPGLYRRSDGYVYLRNSNTQGVADIGFFFGNPGDLPLVGDFNGDGCDTVALYRPSEGKFYVINHLGFGDAGLGAAEHSYYFGNPGDAPFMGDWDGDGIETPGLRRSSNGFVYLRHSNTEGVADVEYFYGDPGDVVFTGDWDADGDDTLGLYRPSTGAVYLRNTNSTGVADHTFGVGQDMHVTGGDF
jgi:subtilisin family serine protease